MKLEKKIRFEGTITTLTGLHIGGSTQSLEIGGNDNPVIRDARSKQPYIPGSTLKGKLRSLLEKNDGINLKNANGISSDITKPIGKIFGVSADSLKKNQNNGATGSDKNQIINSSTRIIVYDSFLDENNALKLEKMNTDAPFTEIKTEVVIDRVTSEANPRNLERVPKDSIFNFTIILNIFTDDDENELTNTLQTGIKLLNDDYLGGSGTRGSGRINMKIVKTEIRTSQDYKDLKDWHE